VIGFRSTVIGHFHRQAGVHWWANPEYRVFGLAVGCGIDADRALSGAALQDAAN